MFIPLTSYPLYSSDGFQYLDGPCCVITLLGHKVPVTTPIDYYNGTRT